MGDRGIDLSVMKSRITANDDSRDPFQRPHDANNLRRPMNAVEFLKPRHEIHDLELIGLPRRHLRVREERHQDIGVAHIILPRFPTFALGRLNAPESSTIFVED